jgi:glycosidase
MPAHLRLASLAAALWLAACAQQPGAHISGVPLKAPADLSPQPARIVPSPLPAGWRHGAFMEIFVRGYQDSDGDGIGDLKGLTSRLDYLKDLGVRGLWLMPITASADHDHGYATTDYRAVEPAYGTLADLDELLKQAHARGIGVVMDYVVNHSAAQHPLFVEARQGTSNPWRDWYVWSETEPKGWNIWDKNPWYWVGEHGESEPWNFKGPWQDLPPAPPGGKQFLFGTFGPHMPDFNLRKPEVWAWHEDNLRFWLNRGLDGFRLDAVPHMIENDAVNWNDQPESRVLTKRLQDLIKSYPQRYVVCEATANPQAYGDDAVCGGAFAFGYVQHFVGAARGQPESVQALAAYYRSASPNMATFISNHDIFGGLRLWDQVDGDVARYKLAAAGYLLQPGTPFIYFGEEVGQASVPGLQGDFPIRAPMSWTANPANAGFTTGQPFRPVAPNVATHNAAAEQADPDSILNFYKAMLALRNSRPSLAQGRFEQSLAQGLVLGYQRVLGNERSLVLINYGTTPSTVQVPGLPAGMQLRPLWPEGGPALTGERLTVPPQAVQVWDVRPAALPH